MPLPLRDADARDWAIHQAKEDRKIGLPKQERYVLMEALSMQFYNETTTVNGWQEAAAWEGYCEAYDNYKKEVP